jgi:crotonobetainyl-CoA:carnitine CoA-transferase CaiB-like acyl-CoA transferase
MFEKKEQNNEKTIRKLTKYTVPTSQLDDSKEIMKGEQVVAKRIREQDDSSRASSTEGPRGRDQE